jgi:hypothetical protein
MIGRLSDEAIAACVAPTLRDLFDAPPGPWARQVTAQLIAVVEHGSGRGADARPTHQAALAAALAALRGNPLVPADASLSTEAAAAAALVAAVGRTDADADAVRRALRPILLAELDGELAETMAMLDGFRGRVRDA